MDYIIRSCQPVLFFDIWDLALGVLALVHTTWMIIFCHYLFFHRDRPSQR